MSDTRPVSSDKQWARVRARLRQEFGESVYRNWLKPLTMDRVENGKATITAPTPFMRDRIEAQFGERVRTAWSVESGEAIVDIEIISAGRTTKTATAEATVGLGADANPDGNPGRNEYLTLPPRVAASDLDRDALGGSLDRRFTFDNFVVGKPNELAYAAAQRVSGSDVVALNP